MLYGVIGLRHKNGIECNNYLGVAGVLDIYKPNMSGIISGGARGVETLVEKWAIEHNIAFKKIKPYTAMFNETVSENARAMESAFFVRNSDIINEVDVLVAFWNGAEHMIMAAVVLAIKAEKPVFIHPLP